MGEVPLSCKQRLLNCKDWGAQFFFTERPIYGVTERQFSGFTERPLHGLTERLSPGFSYRASSRMRARSAPKMALCP